MNRLDHSPTTHSLLIQPQRFRRGLAFTGYMLLGGALFSCSRAPMPEPVSQAQAVSHSKAATQAQEYAPQAFDAAERLKEEGEALHAQHRQSESEAAGAQALAAYNEAFALSQIAIAKERLKQAQLNQEEAHQRLSQLDALQTQVSKDAEGFELQVRVALDMEAVKDVDKLTPGRAEAR